MEKINWRRLTRAIRNEGTVLFIGPNIEKDENGQPVFQKLCRKMVDEYEGELSYDEKEGFLFFIEPEAKNDVIYDLKEYYEQHNYANEIYETIAALPLHLIVSLSPDDSIHTAFKKNGIKHNFVYFDSNKEEIEKPVKDLPLIYSLFGLATQGKYILSQEDYFNYIKLVLSDDVLPKKLISALRSASNYIFIGFDFEKWYVRMLLMILNFHKDKEEKTRHAIQSENTNELYKQLTEKQFNINFIDNNEADFINEFYKKMGEEGLLREIKTRVEILENDLKEKSLLLEEYQEKLMLSDDPKEKLRSEKEIAKLEDAIESIKKELKQM